MRFMIMHKMTPEMENGLPPDPEVIAGVGRLMEDAGKKGIFISGEGLKPSSERVHLVYAGGQRTATDGPFTEAKELVGGFALMQVASKEEAIAWVDRFAKVIGDVEVFVGPVVESWDLGFGTKPADAPLRVLAMHKIDDANADAPPTPELVRDMGALVDEMTKRGVMLATGGLAGTKHGARLHFENGKTKVIDGPFAESKELVAGFAICELPSLAAAIEFAKQFGEVVKVHEIEIRLMGY